MPRYHFHLHNDMDAFDEEGVELADAAAAREYAIQNVREVASESIAQGHLNLDHFIQVTDERGEEVLLVRFGDAITVSQG